MNLQLPDDIRGNSFASRGPRRLMVVQPTPPPQADWPDEALDACAPEGATLAWIETPGPAAAQVWS